MSTINYDHKVKDYIAGLNATGHVTHKSYKKTSVTLHHNAGRLSHEGVLNVWKTRPASAHFDVDARGDVCQYVKVLEYAWAAGSTEGNMRSIHIEMANSTLSPAWGVSETTWKSAARLAGWLFANVVGSRPSTSNFFQHSHWRSTACAGPTINKAWSQVLFEAQKAYDYFKGVTTPPRPAQPAKPATPVQPPRAGQKSSTQIAAEVWAGKWGSGAERARRLTAAGFNAAAIQALVNKGVGKTGGAAPAPRPAAPAGKSVATVAAEVIAGKWGNGADRTSRLSKAGFNAAAVQAEVNRRLGAKPAAPKPAGKSVGTIAAEVIAGKWGNGADRKNRLTKAGYNYSAVQAEVNRRL